MMIPKFLNDLNIISKLGDNPGTDNGLTPNGLKAKFDEGVLMLQTYINDTLVEKINSIFKLDAPIHEGMNMTGPINMNQQTLSGINTPTATDHAVNMEYADSRFVVSDIAPASKSVLWFNTAPGGSANYTAQVSLDDDEQGYVVQATVGDEVYGVGNMTVNQGASGSNYDFTVR